MDKNSITHEIDLLDRKVIQLSKENKALTIENQTLKDEMQKLVSLSDKQLKENALNKDEIERLNNEKVNLTTKELELKDNWDLHFRSKLVSSHHLNLLDSFHIGRRKKCLQDENGKRPIRALEGARPQRRRQKHHR